uniref:Pyruvate dehydrogenase E1 component subunit beta n=1 Tax=Vitis vinifera TaxID=29760 RepID=F6H2U8_VITVI
MLWVKRLGNTKVHTRFLTGFLEKYNPEKVLDTPITEAGFTGIGVGAQHSQCNITGYGSYSGLKALSPYSSEDAHGLLKVVMRDLDPVVFLENELLYGESFLVSAKALDSSKLSTYINISLELLLHIIVIYFI